MSSVAGAVPGLFRVTLLLLAGSSLVQGQAIAEPTSFAAVTQSESVPAAGSAETGSQEDSRSQGHAAAAPAKPRKPSSVPSPAPALVSAAQQTLQSLEAATKIAQRSGIAAPAAWGSASGGDAFSQKRSGLQKQLEAARDEQQTVDAEAAGAAALNQLLVAIATTPPAAEPAAGSASKKNEVPQGRAAGTFALYIAGFSLLCSLLALWQGRLMAHREVRKALTEAGLL